MYSTYHDYYPYDPISEYQQEITIYVNDFYAYGRLKDEAGYHTLFKRNKRMEMVIEILPVIAPPSLIQETEVFPFMVYGAGGPYVNRSLSGAYIIHLPTRIKAQASEAKAFLFNREIAAMLLQSRFYAHYVENKQQKPCYSYLWDNQQIIDHSKREVYSFSQASGFANAFIKALEKSSKFQEK
jgi:protein subunit release factor B